MTGRASTGTPPNQSVERAVQVLSFFTPERPELSLAEMTERLGTSKATTHRYAVALRSAGLLRHDSARSVYTLGPRVVELAAAALAGLRIIQVAGPYMQRLVHEVNESVVLSIWDGEAPVVVRVEDNTDRIVRIVVRTGARLPLDSAQGKVFCAFLTDAVLGDMAEAELASVRTSGVAVNSRVVQGIRTIAVPVFQERELAAAMAVVGTSASVPEDPGAAIALRLRECAELLSTELGFLPTERR